MIEKLKYDKFLALKITDWQRPTCSASKMMTTGNIAAKYTKHILYSPVSHICVVGAFLDILLWRVSWNPPYDLSQGSQSSWWDSDQCSVYGLIGYYILMPWIFMIVFFYSYFWNTFPPDVYSGLSQFYAFGKTFILNINIFSEQYEILLSWYL